MMQNLETEKFTVPLAIFVQIIHQAGLAITTTLVNVYVDVVVFTRIVGTLKTGSGGYWP